MAILNIPSIDSVSSEVSVETKYQKIDVELQNNFKQPIKKVELFLTPRNRGSSELSLREASFDKDEQKKVTISTPTDEMITLFDSPEYWLHYRVTLEDGQWTSNNQHASAKISEWSLQGHWIYAHKGWPLDDETYLAMEVTLL